MRTDFVRSLFLVILSASQALVVLSQSQQQSRRVGNSDLYNPLGTPDFWCVWKPVQLSICSKVRYDYLWLPERFGHERLDKVVRELDHWRHLVNSNAVCHISVPHLSVSC